MSAKLRQVWNRSRRTSPRPRRHETSSRPDDPNSALARPRTVLHVLGVLNRGGVELRTLDIVRALRGDRVRFLVCTLSGLPGSLAEDYRRTGARVIPLRISDPRFAWRFLRLVRQENVDIVHSHVHFSSGFILALAWLAGTPGRIAHFRSDSDGRPSTVARSLRNRLLRTLIRRTATAVIGVAPGTLESNWGGEWSSDDRFAVIPNGIDLTAFALGPDSTLRTELGITAQERLIIHLGRADIPTKNRELAIEIAGELQRQGHPWHLLFVGRDGRTADDADQRVEALRALADREGVLDRVHFLGERQDVPRLLSAADLMLLTSTREGLPGALLEAIACGIPAVSSDVPGALYIAESVPTVTIVPLGTLVANWALAVETAGARASGADLAKPTLARTPFDLVVSLERYRALWGLN